MNQLTENTLWNIFATRALAYVVYGGADNGECFAALSHIESNAPEDWHRAWTTTAERVLGFASTSEAAGHLVSAGKRTSGRHPIIAFRISRSSVLRWIRGSSTPLNARQTHFAECEVK
jgi:hypothetical protein